MSKSNENCLKTKLFLTTVLLNEYFLLFENVAFPRHFLNYSQKSLFLDFHTQVLGNSWVLNFLIIKFL